mmetsp:Transcript_70173/g.168185  ORF Transcript_70173/g.168185 Transcript_70173/m.168185 type:complete len:488 (-) Transcript_70173:478-1941(-)
MPSPLVLDLHSSICLHCNTSHFHSPRNVSRRWSGVWREPSTEGPGLVLDSVHILPSQLSFCQLRDSQQRNPILQAFSRKLKCVAQWAHGRQNLGDHVFRPTALLRLPGDGRKSSDHLENCLGGGSHSRSMLRGRLEVLTVLELQHLDPELKHRGWLLGLLVALGEKTWQYALHRCHDRELRCGPSPLRTKYEQAPSRFAVEGALRDGGSCRLQTRRPHVCHRHRRLPSTLPLHYHFPCLGEAGHLSQVPDVVVAHFHHLPHGEAQLSGKSFGILALQSRQRMILCVLLPDNEGDDIEALHETLRVEDHPCLRGDVECHRVPLFLIRQISSFDVFILQRSHCPPQAHHSAKRCLRIVPFDAHLMLGGWCTHWWRGYQCQDHSICETLRSVEPPLSFGLQQAYFTEAQLEGAGREGITIILRFLFIHGQRALHSTGGFHGLCCRGVSSLEARSRTSRPGYACLVSWCRSRRKLGRSRSRFLSTCAATCL